ncbi:MAG TPA: hypothetical protein PK239_07165 [Chitinophagales bacterium]|nr:hypothetical protein [Chitinophagales bacterium]
MQAENLHRIGYLTQPKSLKGAIVASFEAFFFDFYEQNPHLFPFFIVATKKGKLPYFTESVKFYANDSALVKFQDVNSREAAATLQNADLYLDKNTLLRYFDPDELEEDEEEDYDFLLGYTLFNAADNTPVGEIEEIYYLPGHELLKLTYQNKEVLIPLHDDLIQDINEDHQTIFINLPDGLLDVYTQADQTEDKDTD